MSFSDHEHSALTTHLSPENLSDSLHANNPLGSHFSPAINSSNFTPKKGKWSPEEDDLLRKYTELYGESQWRKISQQIPGRTSIQCLNRWTKILKPGLVKGPWTVKEDALLLAWVKKNGPTQWGKAGEMIQGRNEKQCRERWFNSLNPEIKKGKWTAEEDEIIYTLYQRYGSSWSKISKRLTGRSENAVKNRFYSTQRRMMRAEKRNYEKIKSEELEKSLCEKSLDREVEIEDESLNEAKLIFKKPTIDESNSASSNPQGKFTKKTLNNFQVQANFTMLNLDQLKTEQLEIKQEEISSDQSITNSNKTLINNTVQEEINLGEESLDGKDLNTPKTNLMKRSADMVDFGGFEKLGDIRKKIFGYCEKNMQSFFKMGNKNPNDFGMNHRSFQTFTQMSHKLIPYHHKPFVAYSNFDDSFLLAAKSNTDSILQAKQEMENQFHKTFSKDFSFSNTLTAQNAFISSYRNLSPNFFSVLDQQFRFNSGLKFCPNPKDFPLQYRANSPSIETSQVLNKVEETINNASMIYHSYIQNMLQKYQSLQPNSLKDKEGEIYQLYQTLETLEVALENSKLALGQLQASKN